MKSWSVKWYFFLLSFRRFAAEVDGTGAGGCAGLEADGVGPEGGVTRDTGSST